MKQFQFRASGVAVELFVDDADASDVNLKFKNLFLVFPGMPNSFTKDYFLKNVQKDSAFLYVNYLGSYLSDGVCTPVNCRKSIKIGMNIALKKIAKDLIRNQRVTFNYKNLFIIGYSFACNSILTSRLNDKALAGTALISPLIFLHDGEISKVLSPESKKLFYQANKPKLQFIRRCMENLWRGIEKREWDDYFLGKDKKSLIGEHINLRNVLLVHGEADTEVDISFSEYFAKKFNLDLRRIPAKGHSKELISPSEVARTLVREPLTYINKYI